MTLKFPFSSALCALTLSASAQSTFNSSVQQVYHVTDGNGNVIETIYHQLVSNGELNGTVDMEPIEGDSIRLYLDAVETKDDGTVVDHRADEVQLGYYTPTARIELTAPDYVDGRARTQITRPYSVSVVAEGLRDDPSLQVAAREVHFYHAKEIFGTGGTPNTSEAPTDPTVVISENEKDHHYHDGLSLIKLGDPYVHGYETFSVITLPDFGFPDTSTLDEKIIEICPVTTGSIQGLEAGETYKTLPVLQYSFQNLYPGNGSAGKSITIIENGKTVDGPKYGILCYSGSPITDHNEQDLLDFDVSGFPFTMGLTAPKNVPENANEFVQNTSYSDFIMEQGKGTYTIELYQHTGLGVDKGESGIEILDTVTFTYDPIFIINANISTSE